jgi:hypothetical protein
MPSALWQVVLLVTMLWQEKSVEACLFLSVASYCSFQLSAKSHQMTLGYNNQLLEAMQFARNSESWDIF